MAIAVVFVLPGPGGWAVSTHSSSDVLPASASLLHPAGLAGPASRLGSRGTSGRVSSGSLNGRWQSDARSSQSTSRADVTTPVGVAPPVPSTQIDSKASRESVPSPLSYSQSGAVSGETPSPLLQESKATATAANAASSLLPLSSTSGSVLGTVPVGSSPHGVGVDSATNTIYVANYNSNSVSVIDGATNTVTASVTVGAGPEGVGVDSVTDTIYVANLNSNNVSVIDGATNTVTASVPVGSAPIGVGVDSATDTIYVANIYSNSVSVIDGATNTVTINIAVGSNPEGVGMDSATDTIYVANSGSNSVSVIDGATNTVTASVPVGSAPIGVGVDSATDTIYVASYGSNSVSVIDGVANTVITTINVGSHPLGIGLNSVTDTVYVANFGFTTVSVIDGVTNAVTASVTVGAGPEGVGVDSATDTIYVANSGSNSVSVIDGTTNTVTATVTVGSNPDAVGVDSATDTVYVANINSNSVSVIDGTTNTVTINIAVGTIPSAVGVDSATDTIYVANANSNSVSVIDGATHTVSASVTVGAGPQGVGVDSVTDTIYVANLNSNNVSVIDGATNTITATIAVGSGPYAVGVDSATDTIYVANDVSNNVSAIDGATNAVTATVTVGTFPSAVGVDSSTNTIYVTDGANTVSVIYIGTALWVPPPASSRASMDYGQTTAVTFSESGLAGGTPPYSYAWNGLPAGCVSSAPSFMCSPSSAAPGNYTVTLTATDSSHPSQSRTSGSVVFTIFPDPAVTSAPTASPPSVDLGQPVTFSALVANLGSGGDVYSWTSGLPSGCLSVNALSVSCTPTVVSAWSILFFVQDSNGFNVSSPPLYFTVHNDPQVSTPAPSRVSADVGQPVLISTTASGGTNTYGRYTWSYPPEMGCAPSTSNVLSCLPTATVNAGTVTVNVTDTNGYTSTSATLSYTVSAGPTITTPTATRMNLDVGQSTVFSFTATNGTALWSVLAWTGLPTGCTSVNASTLTCSPSVSGTYAVSASITDSNGMTVTSGTVTLTVPPALMTPSFTVSRTALDVGQSVGFSASVSGGTGIYTYTWGTLPAGCATANTALLTCTPASVGSGTFATTVTVTDSNGVGLISTAVTLTVSADPTVSTPSATRMSLDVGQSTSLSATAANGTGLPSTYAWAGLPGGCSSSDSLAITCVPTQAGTYSVTVSIQDSNGFNVSSVPLTLTISSRLNAPTLSSSVTTLDVGQSVTLSATFSGGAAPYTYNWSGLPPGCVNGNTATLTCNPITSGSAALKVTVTDSNGVALASTGLNLTVSARLSPGSIITTPGTLDLGQVTKLMASVSGGSAGLTYSWSGLPSGCSTNSTASLSCTPSGPGTFWVAVAVTDSNGETVVVGPVSLVVAPALGAVSVSTSVSSLEIGGSVTFTASVSGGTQPLSYSWSGLPTGCVTLNTPTLTCVPTTTGTYRVNVTVTDAAGVSQTASSAQVTVKAAPALGIVSISASVSSLRVGGVVAFTVIVTGGTAPYTYSWSGLPAGCASVNTPSLTCVPTASGTYSVSVKITDTTETSVTSAAQTVTVTKAPTPAATGLSNGLDWGILALAAVALIVGIVGMILAFRRREPGVPASEKGQSGTETAPTEPESPAEGTTNPPASTDSTEPAQGENGKGDKE